MENITNENRVDLIIQYLTALIKRDYRFINLSNLNEVEESELKKQGYSISRHSTEIQYDSKYWQSEGVTVFKS